MRLLKMSNDSKKIASSPDRHSFSRNNAIERSKNNNTGDAHEWLNFYDHMRDEEYRKILDPEWQKTNLEYDLRSNEWMCEKVKSSDTYAQNLYAALCNNDFQKLDVIPILKGEHWHCSWRYAGGIVSHMREHGDYIDWYCSGISDYDNSKNIDSNYVKQKYVSESVVTDELREDFKKLGWVVIDNE